VEKGDYEERNPYSKDLEKIYEKDLLQEKPEN